MALKPGTTLGVYEITAPVGAGGMGEVYQARDTSLNRDVAIVERFRLRDGPRVGRPLRVRLEGWARTSLRTLAQEEPDLPRDLGDRAADVWEPLLAVADLADGAWPARARRAATLLSGRVAADDDSVSIRLLADVAEVFTDEVIRSADLVTRLIRLEDRPWGDWAGGRPITQARVARLLGPFGIHPMKLRIGEKTANGYTTRMFADPWSRYLPRQVEQRNSTNNGRDAPGL